MQTQTNLKTQNQPKGKLEMLNNAVNSVEMDLNQEINNQLRVDAEFRQREIQINDDFRDLIIPLSEEEFKGLEESILRDGCTDPLIIWKGMLLDGHNRFSICNKHGVEFKTHEVTSIEDEIGAKRWIIGRQLKKRNLDPERRLEYAFKDYELAKEEAAMRQKRTQFKAKSEADSTNDEVGVSFAMVSADLRSPSNAIQVNSDWSILEDKTKGKAIEKIAGVAGMGTRKVEMYKKIREESPELKKDILNKKISVDKAYRQIRKAERRNTYKQKEWPSGKYSVILCDCPWEYHTTRAGHGDVAEHYDTMSLEKIKALDVGSLAEKECVLFMWATVPLLRSAFEVLDAWKFKYKTLYVWDKVRSNIGSYCFVNCELLLVATYGEKPFVPTGEKLFDNVVTLERSEKHSEKPEYFREMIDALYPWGNRVELFARKKVEGWEAFGNEV